MSAAGRSLHIGGREVQVGWEILNIQPGAGVDHVGDVSDLSRFPSDAFGRIYVSHVLEHVPHVRVRRTLAGLFRILRPEGTLYVSVPDLETLCRLMLSPRLSRGNHWYVMRMMFGGQTDANDFHYVGWTFELLDAALRETGFTRIRRVESLGRPARKIRARPASHPARPAA